MRDYGKVSTSIWNSQKFSKVSDDARLLYLYLHTCPHVNSVGCFVLKDGYATADLGWDAKRYLKAMHTLCDAFLTAFDRDESLVRIVNFLKFDPFTNPKHAQGAAKLAISLPDSTEKLNVLRDMAECKHGDKLDILASEIDRLSKGYRNPEPEPEPDILSPSDSCAIDGKSDSMPLFGGQAKSKPKPPDRFEEFWNAYPHRGGAKKGKAAARKKWDAALKRKVEPGVIIAGAMDFQRDRKAVDGFAPDPARWLHNEMWLDEIEEVKGQDNGNRFDNGGSGGGSAGTRRPANGGHHDALLAGFGQAALNVERGTRSDGFGHSEDFHTSHAAGDRGQGGADPE